jgi:hypothetical protein
MAVRDVEEARATSSSVGVPGAANANVAAANAAIALKLFMIE